MSRARPHIANKFTKSTSLYLGASVRINGQGKKGHIVNAQNKIVVQEPSGRRHYFSLQRILELNPQYAKEAIMETWL